MCVTIKLCRDLETIFYKVHWVYLFLDEFYLSGKGGIQECNHKLFKDKLTGELFGEKPQEGRGGGGSV
jgi:hypothetical protein